MKIPSNPVLDKLPAHLRQYIKPQNYEHYTAQNQAVWKYVMRKNIHFLKEHAHHSYLEGLHKTGVSINEIPSMYGMNRILQDIGWAAASVDGLIPSASFMEFQAYNVLVIASEIRHLEHIEYTPTPDIIHESAGHAPILANPEYAEYLRRFGTIGSRAISSQLDVDLFQAMRQLSILKEKNEKPAQIDAAEKEVSRLQDMLGDLSEMTKIKNLHWWTVEYGLIGTLKNYKLYGAGLLSSIGESKWCMSNKVDKKQYTLEAAYQNFDVTKAQPQLFVTPSFAHLSKILEELADTMALRHGGRKGVEKLIASKQLGTIELTTGLQISGHFSKVTSFNHKERDVAYIQLKGPVAFAQRDKELIGHGIATHALGFGTPLGKLKGIPIAIEDMSPSDLERYKIYENEEIKLEFESGVVVKGKIISGTRNKQGKVQIIRFVDCLVTHQNEVLYQPSWGVYDMAVGKRIESAYAGAADENSFDFEPHKISSDILRLKETPLEQCFKIAAKPIKDKAGLENEWNTILQLGEGNWLLVLNFYEKCLEKNRELSTCVLSELMRIQEQQPAISHLIEDGLALFKSKEDLMKIYK
ncbi:MAG: phenylalanine 4-monooxygenase [Flavobacteriaceae bacterium]|nr:MAG: phenylalanine 4-monooxygenase [Flavobacteriaceae bacterium]